MRIRQARIRQAIYARKIGRSVIGNVVMLGWRGRQYYQSDPWRGSWASEGGGVLVNQAPHQLDLLLWYLGDINAGCLAQPRVNFSPRKRG